MIGINKENIGKQLKNASQQTGCFIGYSAEEILVHGKKEQTHSNSLFFNYNGGRIVVGKDSLVILCIDKHQQLNHKRNIILTSLVQQIQKKHSCEIVGNDIIINGTYKLGSIADGETNEYKYAAIFISAHSEEARIQQVCSKQKHGTSIGFMDLGYSKEEIYSLVKTFLD